VFIPSKICLLRFWREPSCCWNQQTNWKGNKKTKARCQVSAWSNSPGLKLHSEKSWSFCCLGQESRGKVRSSSKWRSSMAMGFLTMTRNTDWNISTKTFSPQSKTWSTQCNRYWRILTKPTFNLSKASNRVRAPWKYRSGATTFRNKRQRCQHAHFILSFCKQNRQFLAGQRSPSCLRAPTRISIIRLNSLLPFPAR